MTAGRRRALWARSPTVKAVRVLFTMPFYEPNAFAVSACLSHNANPASRPDKSAILFWFCFGTLILACKTVYRTEVNEIPCSLIGRSALDAATTDTGSISSLLKDD